MGILLCPAPEPFAFSPHVLSSENPEDGSHPSSSRERTIGPRGNPLPISLRNVFRIFSEALPRWEAGVDKKPLMVEDLPALSVSKTKSQQGVETIFVLMDGMRWDLWEYIKENLIGPMANQLRIIDEGALWAHLPSTTPRQMERIRTSHGKDRHQDLENRRHR